MERYPSYRLEDFFKKSFLQGGLTLRQMFVLYEHSQERLLEKHKFLASVIGAEVEEGVPTAESFKETDGAFVQSGALFKDPKLYSHLGKEEKETLTQQMLSQHRFIVQQLPIKDMGKG
jgi:hypothetical protein